MKLSWIKHLDKSTKCVHLCFSSVWMTTCVQTCRVWMNKTWLILPSTQLRPPQLEFSWNKEEKRHPVLVLSHTWRTEASPHARNTLRGGAPSTSGFEWCWQAACASSLRAYAGRLCPATRRPPRSGSSLQTCRRWTRGTAGVKRHRSVSPSLWSVNHDCLTWWIFSIF